MSDNEAQILPNLEVSSPENFEPSSSNFKHENVIQQERNPDFTAELIKLVHKVPILYDHSHGQYRNAQKKLEAWNYVKRKVGYLGSAQELADYWKIIRDRYTKAKKKVTSNMTTKFKFLKELKFLDQHITDRSSWYAKDTHGRCLKTQRLRNVTNDEFYRRLIQLVYKNPCFYNNMDPNYRRFEHKCQIWAKIADELGFDGSVNDIYKQWKKLRDRYVRELRKLRLNGRNKNACRWEFFKNMSWMEIYIEEPKSLEAYEIKLRPTIEPITKNIYIKGKKKAEIKILKPVIKDNHLLKRQHLEMPQLTPEMPKLLPQITANEECQSSPEFSESSMTTYNTFQQESISGGVSSQTHIPVSIQPEITYYIDQSFISPDQYIISSDLFDHNSMIETRHYDVHETLLSAPPSTSIVYTITKDTDLNTLPKVVREAVIAQQKMYIK